MLCACSNYYREEIEGDHDLPFYDGMNNTGKEAPPINEEAKNGLQDFLSHCNLYLNQKKLKQKEG